MRDPAWRVAPITTEQTHPVRLAVLRSDTPTKEVRFAEDDEVGVIHLGAFSLDEADRVIATSTWIPRTTPSRPDAPAVQLRGMATLRSYQGQGVGAALIAVGIDHARAIGAKFVWANARDAALAFYVRQGFSVEGDGFIDGQTQLPHHVVICVVT